MDITHTTVIQLENISFLDQINDYEHMGYNTYFILIIPRDMGKIIKAKHYTTLTNE